MTFPWVRAAAVSAVCFAAVCQSPPKTSDPAFILADLHASAAPLRTPQTAVKAGPILSNGIYQFRNATILDLIAARHVDRNGEHLAAARRGDAGLRGIEPGRIDVGDGDVHAESGEALGGGETDAARAARDDSGSPGGNGGMEGQR